MALLAEKNTVVRTRQAMSLAQAVQASPTLAHLSERIRVSQQMLHAVAPLLPSGLQRSVQAGPWDQESWCLLVNNSAAATKLKHLLPRLQQTLSQHGHSVSTIRIKIQKMQQT